jgi:PEP-CTERM motif
MHFTSGRSAKLLLGTVLIVGLLDAAPAFSETLVDTGAGGTEFVGSPALFGYSDPGYFQYWAGQFTLTDAYTIESVSGWMGGWAAGGIDIKLYADGGEVPGAELFSQSFVAATYTFDPRWENFQGLNWNVGAGTYWVAFEPQPLDMSGSGFSTTMLVGAASPLSNYAVWSDVTSGYVNQNGYTLGFRVEGTMAPVPEPESYALIVAGLVLVTGIARRRRRSTRSDARIDLARQ